MVVKKLSTENGGALLPEKYVSETVVRRLPKYYRKLLELEKRGVERISSQELSQEMGLNASQIRRDFNCFGGFGQQGYGYQVKKLKDELIKILGLDQTYRCAIVGSGNIGRALLLYKGFEMFQMNAIFDVNPEIIGTKMDGVEVRSMFNFDEYVKNNDINVGIICTPASVAQETCDHFAQLGIKAVWNFTPFRIRVPEDIVVQNTSLYAHLAVMFNRLNFNEIK